MSTKNTKLFYLSNFLGGASYFWLPIIVFFYTQYIGMNLGWAIFLTTLPGLASTVFEIPTGALVDIYGRKKMLIFGIICQIVGLSFFLWANSIPTFVVAIILVGFGQALGSGNFEGIIHDELTEKGKSEKYFSVENFYQNKNKLVGK